MQTTVSLYLLYFLVLIPPFLFISKVICMREASLFLQYSFLFSHLGYHSASLKTMTILLADFRKAGLIVRNADSHPVEVRHQVTALRILSDQNPCSATSFVQLNDLLLQKR